jgi:cytochrome c peroxidase
MLVPRLARFAVPLMALSSIACGGDDTTTDLKDGTFTDAEWAKAQELGPLPDVPADTTNKHADDPAAATLGQRLFFEKSYSGPLKVGDDGMNGSPGAVDDTGKVGCVSCHQPANWWMDRRSNPNSISIGVNFTERNAPALVNVVFYKWFGWGGKQDSMWNQAAGSPESKENTGGNRLAYAHMLWDKYRADYDAIFDVPLDPALDPLAADAARFPPSGKPKSAMTDPDGPWEMMAEADRDIITTIMANSGKAMAAYERLLVSRNAPLDRYLAEDFGAITESAKKGLKLFVGKAACNACHSGPTFTDNLFHNTGIAQNVGIPEVPDVDEGRFTDISKVLSSAYNGVGDYSDDQTAGAAKLDGLMPEEADKGKFRTKALREVSETGVFQHNGSLTTLEEVVHLYNLGGAESGFSGTKDPKIKPLNLTSEEEADLVAFLKTLTGDPVPAALGEDTSAQ